MENAYKVLSRKIRIINILMNTCIVVLLEHEKKEYRDRYGWCTGGCGSPVFKMV